MKKKSLFLSLCAGLMAVLLLAGCSVDALQDQLINMSPVVKNETIASDSKWINSSIDGSIDADTPVNLKDDFYTAINKDYLIQPLEKGQKEASRFVDVQEKYEDNLYSIMTADPSDTTGLDLEVMSEEKLLHLQELVYTVADLGKDADTRNALGAEPLRPYIEKLAGISTLDELTDYLCNTNGTNLFFQQLAPFKVTTPIDRTLQSGYVVQIRPKVNLSLPDTYEYTNLDGNGTYYHECNRAMMQYVLGQLGYTDKEIDKLLRACYRFESKLVRGIPDDETMQDSVYDNEHNNIYDRDGLQALAGNYPLMTILSAYGMENSDGFTVLEPAQLKEVGKLYTAANLEDMKAYFIVNTVLEAATLLDETTYELHKAYEKQNGTPKNAEEKQTNKNHPDFDEWEALYERFVIPTLDDAWQQVYIGHFCTAEEKRQAMEMTDQIMAAFETCIRDADWMSDETRGKALEKLSVMGKRILYPDRMIDYSSLSFADCNNLMEIVAAITQFSVRQKASMVSQPVSGNDWDMTEIATTEVNAFYAIDYNAINITAALLADHYFFAADAPIEENLANLGSIVGHEITHGFDTMGYRYDKNGKYASWWTDADRLAFDLRADDLIKYYSGLAPVVRNEFLVGKNVSGEAIADMGGVKCGMIIAAGMPDFDYDLYFRSYANLWRDHTTYKFAIELAGDAHPTEMLRTNVTLMQFEEFQKTYDIQPGDGMYLAAEDRILVW